MAVLLLACVGPMQSWGTRSRFTDRDTEREPSKSGVIGMMCAAIGRDRAMPVDDFAAMKMGVRVDLEGVLQKDFQTAQNVVTADRKKRRDLISNRWYLSDAAFLVGIEGDAGLLKNVHDALKKPVWPLALGRKSYLPSVGPYLEDGYFETGTLQEALESCPPINAYAAKYPQPLRFVLETAQKTENVRMDVPLSFAHGNRKFAQRYVQIIWKERADVFE